MNIEQLEYIVEVAKHHSLTTASEQLHVSQSAISQSITRMEEELGIKIFHRSRNGTVPTEEGKKIVGKAYEILLKLQELKQMSITGRQQFRGNLTVSVIPNMMVILLETLTFFRKDHPLVNIEIEEKSSDAIFEDVKAKRTDIGFLTLSKPLMQHDEHFLFEPLVRGKAKAFVGRKSPLSYKSGLTMQEFAQYPLVLFKSQYVKRIVQKLEKKYGPLNILFTTDSNDVVKRAIMDGMGIGIGTSHMISFDPQVLSGEIVTLDIWDYEEEEETYFGWICLKEKALSPAAMKFLQLLKSRIGSYPAELMR
jgi:DNA-binding transcriptional LysR family regulator